ncbi:MFS transporter [Magnetovibrio sp.]|uniref:MFS transporter n=1 Tax=Magnetovibrio sp. TaxID=2024836 RepID=UPI002F932C83
MYGTLLSISALLAGVFAMSLGFGLQATLLGVRAGIEGFPVTVTGFIMAIYYAGYIVGSLLSPRLVQTVGHIRVFAALASLASAAALLHAVMVTPPTWVLFRVMTGFCVAGLLVVAESWLNHASTNTNRGSILSVYMVTSLGATALGQLLLNVAPVDGTMLFILVSVLVSVSLVPMALSSRTVPTLQPTARMKIRKLFERSPMGAVGCFSTGLINGSFWGMGAVYAHTAGLDTRGISLFMAMVVLGGIISQWPMGRLSDHVDRRWVLAGLAAATAAASLGIATWGGVSHEIMFTLGWVFGAMAFPLYAISIAHVNDVLDIDDFVPASSALLLLYAMGAVVGPFVGGAAMDAIGAPGLFYFNAAVAIALLAFTLKRLYFGHAVKNADKEDFIGLPRTTAQALEMAAQVVETANREDDPAQP